MISTKKNQRAEFVPARLSQARKAKAWTKSRLADEVQLTRQAISQFEKGKSKPSPENLRAIARMLDQPEHFFTWPVVSLETQKESPPTFRSMASSTARARDQAETWLEWIAAMVGTLSVTVDFPPVAFPNFTIEDFTRLTNDDIDAIALETRKHFGLGIGPISDLTLLLENKGAIVVYKKLNKSLSGLSQWFSDRPFVLIDPSTSASRARFSLAHELGHLILHKQLSESDLLDTGLLKLIENQAHYFAGSFALPEQAIAKELYGLDWQSLVSLKYRWHMAISSIVMRLSNLGLISDSQKTRLFREISARNARVHEPLDNEIPHCPPRLLKKIAELLEAENVLTGSDIPEVVRFNKKLIADFAQIPIEAMLPKTIVDNVVSLRR